jgi:hypothetical protein
MASKSKKPKASPKPAASSMDDFTVVRGDDGRPEPYLIEVPFPNGPKKFVKILPTTIASVMRLTDASLDCVHWPLDDKIDYVQRHIVEPNFGALTKEEIIETVTLFDLDMLLIGAVQNGGPMRRKAESNPTAALVNKSK